MNNIAQETIYKLLKLAPHTQLLSEHHIWQSNISLGLEIEVKWRDYFPTLWNKYLKDTPYNQLDRQLQQQLTHECNELEKHLVPLLEKTVEYGVPKGADKYWEFAFDPATNIYLIYDQINILRCANLIPSGNHSLHITIGNMHECIDVYWLLMLLELNFTTKQRIASAMKSHSVSSAWSRKGYGGLFVKDASELKQNALSAVELRTLQLSDDTQLIKMLQLISIVSDVIINNKQCDIWTMWIKHAKDVLPQYGLMSTNWKKPHMMPEIWQHYIACFDDLKIQLNCEDTMNNLIGDT